METMRLGRNDVCRCGSGKKYKKCCLPQQSGAAPVFRAPLPGRMPTIPLGDPGLEAFEHKDVVFVKGKGWTHESELKPGDQYRLKGGGWETVMPERVIGTTQEHPFYSQERGWTPAGDLRPGEMIRTEDGWVPVRSVEDTGRYETVYNLRVEGYHTYFVGAPEWGFAVWVHNATYATQADLAKDLVRHSASRVTFRGMEVRAVRKLDHLTEAQLRYGYAHGVSPRNAGGGGKVILHHHRQQVQGPLIEMPQRAHEQSNRLQHPLGNSGGVGNAAEKGAFNNWRNAYWQARHAEELFMRGLKP